MDKEEVNKDTKDFYFDCKDRGKDKKDCKDTEDPIAR